jgi:hypothetical protein
MKILRCLPAVLIFIASTASAQFNTQWNVLSNDSVRPVSVSNFASVSEARTIINEIIAVMNLKVNFEVREANVPNAGAVFYNGKRYILYNPVFIKQIDRAAQTDWASISILAHEIGHHVKGHTFKAGGNSYDQELEADEFSGLVLKRMGATLDESQKAMNMIASDRASGTHPARAYRLDAIARGWNAGSPVNSDIATPKNEAKTTTASAVTEKVNTPITASVKNTRETFIADRYILADVNFSIDKDNDYFITYQNNVVRWDGNNLVVVGKLAKMKNAEYPFYIYDATKNYVLISKNGYLIDPKGTKVGYLSMHTAAATAAR